MIVVFAMAAALWFIGAAMGVSREARLPMLGLLYVAVLALQVALPEGNPLKEATGGSPALWLLLGLALAVILAYRYFWKILKRAAEKREAEAAPVKQEGTFSEVELDRYSRQIVLREIGGPGQQRLAKARVLVIGAGGLGAPVLQYLAAAGVGTIGVIDDDVVEATNLQRQVIHTDERMGMAKVFSAQAQMAAQNPWVTVRPYHRRLTEEIAGELFGEYDLIIDGTDNFETRYLANRVAVANQLPLISGALSQWEGQVSIFDPARGTPCYQCIFAEAPAEGLAPSCAEAGVLGPLPGVVGSIMASEAIKLLTDAGTPLLGTMLIHDALHGESRKMALRRRPDCPICAAKTAKAS